MINLSKFDEYEKLKCIENEEFKSNEISNISKLFKWFSIFLYCISAVFLIILVYTIFISINVVFMESGFWNGLLYVSVRLLGFICSLMFGLLFWHVSKLV